MASEALPAPQPERRRSLPAGAAALREYGIYLALALLRKPSVNLNYTAGPEIIRSCVRQCNIRHVLTSRLFT